MSRLELSAFTNRSVNAERELPAAREPCDRTSTNISSSELGLGSTSMPALLAHALKAAGRADQCLNKIEGSCHVVARILGVVARDPRRS